MAKIKLDNNKKVKQITLIVKKKRKNSEKSHSNNFIKDEPADNFNKESEQNEFTKCVDVNTFNEDCKTDENRKHEIAGKFVRPPALVDFDQIKGAVLAVLKIHEQRLKTSNTLFEDEQPIFLQISSMKVPKCSRKILRLQLPHTLVTGLSDVCLIVTDLKRGRRVDHEPTINHYEEFLRSKGITQIKSVIPLRQLKVEYDQFELKSRLLRTHDYFLVDSKISGHVFHILGKIFQSKRKNPTPIRMHAKDLKYEINKALCKVPLYIHSNGDSHAVQVAHTHQKINQIVDNVYSAVQILAQVYPGGYNNIRALFIKTIGVPAIPIYMTLKSPNTVTIPNVKSKRPAARKNVCGELSTRLNTTVVVHPDGDVKVIKNNFTFFKNKETTADNGENNTITKKKETVAKTHKKRKIDKIKHDNQNNSKLLHSDSSEDEEFASNVEDAYLKNLQEVTGSK